MSSLPLVLAPVVTFLVGVPLATAGIVVTTATAADEPALPACAVNALDGTTTLPAPGAERRASLTNPPTEIPAELASLYRDAAAQYGLAWPLLAGVGMAETDHGRLGATSTAGAQGLMQFLPATFAAFGVDGDGDGVTSITSDADSVFSAANYLRASGASEGDEGVRRALFAYNHATWYVNDVLHYAQQFAAESCTPAADVLPPGPEGECPPTGSPAEKGLQPGALRALRCVKAAFPWITTLYGVGSRPNTSDHPAGRAVDFMIPEWNTPAGRARGWEVARWLERNAAALGVKYLIYDDHVWRSYRAGQGWTPYTHPNGATPNPTLRHLDHVHLSTS